jgi:hypothetical protein
VLIWLFIAEKEFGGAMGGATKSDPTKRIEANKARDEPQNAKILNRVHLLPWASWKINFSSFNGPVLYVVNPRWSISPSLFKNGP